MMSESRQEFAIRNDFLASVIPHTLLRAIWRTDFDAKPGFFGTGSRVHVFVGNDIFGWWCVCRGASHVRPCRKAATAWFPPDYGPAVIERLKGEVLGHVPESRNTTEGYLRTVRAVAKHVQFNCQRCAADLGMKMPEVEVSAV